jgi:sugar phosphate permease
VLLSGLGVTSSLAHIVACLVVTGLGQGMFQAPNARTLMAAAPRHAQGVASGVLATGRVMGQSLSVALAGASFSAAGGAAAGERLTSGANLSLDEIGALQRAFVHGLRVAFLVCAAISAVGVVTAVLRGDVPRR